MERRFDMSDFERSLKDHADQFKLVPSKRVWNGIYNNLHPGSKWPSISIAIVFIITLISIGNLNNSPAHSDKNSQLTRNNTSENNQFSSQLANNISSKKDISKKGAVNKESENASINKQSSNSESKISSELSVQNLSPKIVLIENNNEKNSSKSLAGPDFAKDKNYTTGEKNVTEEFNQGAENSLSSQKSNEEKSIGIYQNNSTENLPVIQNSLLSEIVSPLKKELLVHTSFEEFIEPFQFSPSLNFSNPASKPINNTDFNSQKSIATANVKKIKRKKNKNVEWTFYAAPTIGTVSFNKKRNIATSPSNVSSVIILPNDPSFGLIRTAKIGFETGAQMSYKIFRKFSFITGANFTYSGYNNMSNLIHPTFASLNLIDRNSIIYSKSYVTNYGNGQSPNRIPLTNYSFEVSVPVGLKYNIWGNEKIQIDAVSTVDPSIVLKKNAFIISSDGRYYINDASLVRNINLAGHFGSYISFSVNKIKWHIGPDIRYQLLSTYKSYYPSKEHFIDYGIRIGISR
jgi:hypothetical protein